jgi:TonB-linked SusC/RagA family outer membrane protein
MMKEKLKILVLFLTIGLQTYGQVQKITGTVTDDTGGGLPGATILVVGSKENTSTDNTGKYTIKALPGSQLKFSFIGYSDQTKTVGKNIVINVSLKTDSSLLDQVVVLGYQTQKRSTVVGAVSQTSGESLRRQGVVTNLSDALQGALPGVTILPTTGMPGGPNGDSNNARATEILIRGKATWNSSAPLILVDGVERNMNDIDVSEVETISVLKDASATAVFGMKGGNGVILITSKRGLVGKTKLNIEYNRFYEDLSKYPRNSSTLEGYKARNYAIINDVDVVPQAWAFYQPEQALNHLRNGTLPYAYPDNNWRELMTKIAESSRLNINISGGNKFMKYFGSLSYLNQGDIFRTQDIGQGYNPEFSYNRFNVRTNLDFTVTSTTQFSIGLATVYGVQSRPRASLQGISTILGTHASDVPVIQYEDGIYGTNDGSFSLIGNNEFVNLNLSGTNVTNRSELNTDFTLTQKLDFITKGLDLRARVAFDNSFTTEGPEVIVGGAGSAGVVQKEIKRSFYLAGGFYNPATKSYELNGIPLSTADMIAAGYAIYVFPSAPTDGFEWVQDPNSYPVEEVNAGAASTNLLYEGKLGYNRKFGSHSFSGLMLFSRQIVERGSSWPQKREDWVSRAAWDFKSKYFAEFNGAYNGSEKFGPGYKFDFFPSGAVGWNIAQEKFIKNNVKFINNLKVKYSIGVVGNDRIVGEQWGYLTTWNQGGNYRESENFARFGINAIGIPASSAISQGLGLQKYFEGVPGNPELRWEKAQKQNLGLEFGFLKNSLTGSVDLFKENRYDMLVSGRERTIPSIYGQRPPAANIGKVNSQGYEIEMAYQKSYENSFNFKIGGSFTRAENIILEKEDAILKPFYQQQAGYPIGQNRSNIQTGFIRSYDDLYNGVNNIGINTNILPGDFRLLDYNANGVIDPDDAALYGYPTYPLNTWNGTLNMGYKGWSFNVLFYGTNNVTRVANNNRFFFNTSVIQPWFINDTWTPEYGNSNPTFPHLTLARNPQSIGTYSTYDGTLVRLQSAEISYTLPKKWSKTFGSGNTRLFANGRNLLLWIDVPSDGEGGNIEESNYPLKTTVTVGAIIQF